jgi:AcrR family transcriptional regulator
MATPVERPLRSDAERNRQRILDAAREVFAERGLGATLDDVADAAGVGVGTVYRRFPNKAVLVDELFEDRIGEIVAIAEAALDVPDAWDGLVQFLDASMAMQCSDRGLKDVIVAPRDGQDRLVQVRERLNPKIAQLFDRAKAAGAVRGDVELADLQLIGMSLGAVIDATRDVEPDAYRRVLTLALDGIRPSSDTPLPGRALDEGQAEQAMLNSKRR